MELKRYSPHMAFLQEVDKRTGYRSKQMLVTPILDAPSGELLGVVQFINNKQDLPFGAIAEEGAQAWRRPWRSPSRSARRRSR